MKVLIACEESQEVCRAFRERGHEAYSCDIQDCSGGHPEWHLKGDVLFYLSYMKWDIFIGHPSCQFLSNAGARWLYSGGKLNEDRYKKGLEAKAFFMELLNLNIPKIAIENPLPSKIYELPKPTQIIQPYEYGHPYSKKTLLWLKGLPLLKPTNIINDYKTFLPSNTGGKKRGQKHRFVSINKIDSSKTFKGIADAMADQWG